MMARLMEDLPRFLVSLAVLLFSVIFHEMAHAWSAWKMGDPTGKLDHRLSWNPIHHIDPFMTFLLPFLTYATLGFPFGGAKPVRINPLNFENPGRGWMISSAFGPLSNILLSVVSFALLFGLHQISPSLIVGRDFSGDAHVTWNGYVLILLIFTNAGLATFNLIPIPPLDGSRVLRHLLPESGKQLLDRIEPVGIFILLALSWARAFSVVFFPMYWILQTSFVGAFGSETTREFFQALVHR